MRCYKWGTFGLFRSYKDYKQHADYDIIVGITFNAKINYLVYLPSTDRLVARSKPEVIVEDIPQEWGFPARNISILQLRTERKRVNEQDSQSSADADVQSGQVPSLQHNSIIDMRYISLMIPILKKSVSATITQAATLITTT
jgi:hypothetical protein